MLTGVALDHVAVAVESWADSWPRYVVELGGAWGSGGQNVGFAPFQLRFANDARLEVLQPWQPESNPFLRRFLDMNGPGPHHLTFKVPDLDVALDEAEQAGFTPVAVDRSDPGWREGFLHPRQAMGVVVQLAQAEGSWQSPEPAGFPTAGPATPAALHHVVHAVADLAGGLRLFAGLLGGRETRRDHAPDGTWQAVTLDWGGALAVRLVAPASTSDGTNSLVQWLGGRLGRVHHLAFSQPRLDAADDRHAPVPGVTADEEPFDIVAPEDNLGVRLVVTRTAGPEPRGTTGTR